MNIKLISSNIFLKTMFLLLAFTNSYSHPHTFIEVEPTIQIKEEKIDKLHINWTIDEMTSMMLIMELDTNADGKIDKEENRYIYENYFKSLGEYNFYMQIFSQKDKHTIKPENFKASIKDNKMVYEFDLLKKIDLKNLKINFFDESLFVGMMLEKDFIKIDGIQKGKITQLKKEIFGIN